MKDLPRVGIMDSGAGGLGVLSECLKLAGGVRYYYFADGENAPYGSKSEGEIASFVRAGLQMFVRLGADAAVLACNTATAACVEEMRQNFAFPVVGTEPAVHPAAAAGCKNVLVLVTPRTAKTARFRALLARERGCVFTVFAPPLLASAMEEFAAEGTLPTLSDHLPKGEFDGVVLGCTHYTLAKGEIARFYGAPVFDGNYGTAQRLFSLMGRDGCPPIGKFSHQKGALTTNKRSAPNCDIQTKNEVIFLNSSKKRSKLYTEQMFFLRLMPKNVRISQMDENFF